MKFDQAVDKILQENYFGGSPNERQTRVKRHTGVSEDEQEKDFISPDEVKAMQKMLNQGIEDRRGGKKKSNLQMVDLNQLSPAGREFISKLDHSADMYKQGGQVKSPNPQLTSQARDVESEAFRETFGQTKLDYVGYDERDGHIYRYPDVVEGQTGLAYDKDGFRLQAQMDGDHDEQPDVYIDLFPLDQFDVVNLFAKGSPEPIVTRGKITQG